MATTTTGSATNNLPTYIQPYVTDLLSRSQALTSNQPYTPYTGQRVAGLTAQQQTTGQSVSGLDAGNLMTQGTDALQAGAQYAPSTESFGLGAAAQYMNPYQQGVTDVAKREATRDSLIQDNRNDSAAAQQGAFGGSRQAIVDAENQRNLGTRLNDIQTQGLNASWGQAQQQFNADQTRQQQDRQFGTQSAIKSGDSLVDAGGKSFGLQSTAGMLDQNVNQQNLNTGYQDFLTQQENPYNQLSFMRNMVSGFPGSTTTSTSSATPNKPSTIDNIAGGVSLLGGIGSIFGWAEGGPVSSGRPMPQMPPQASGLNQARIAQVFRSMQ